MSSSDIALSIRGLSKSYTITHGGLKRPSFRELIVDRIRRPLHRPETETFWALRDVSFEVARGDVVGIIGRNGAGKSTLLKILSRITEPTQGEIDVYGRIGSLLEVGTGFHPELTGRENIFLNGAILGMRRAEIRQRFNAIVEFAEIEQFLDTPVKRYSSGMYVRLAFAVAAHLDPEILIVDEVLAVGDAQFQRKCLGKMKDVASGGRTVLFVSHNIAAITTLCTAAVVLRKGQIVHAGHVDAGLKVYNDQVEMTAFVDLQARNASIPTKIASLAIYNGEGKLSHSLTANDRVRIEIRFRTNEYLVEPRIGLAFNNHRGERIFAVATYLGDSRLDKVDANISAVSQFHMPAIVPGVYTIDVGLYTKSHEKLQEIYRAVAVEVTDSNYLRITSPIPSEIGPVLVRSQWSLQHSSEVEV
jgi:lipopolysaccharide transport system ATP-binding protein